jgi:DNA modification methylase
LRIEIFQGDCRDVLKTLPANSVHCCVTSPPYFNLRDYEIDGQIGLEKSPDEYVAQMVAVFREVWRGLRHDGTCWVNLGDSYGGGNGGASASEKQTSNRGTSNAWKGCGMPKQLLGIPWRVAFALQADGWYLRQDIIWHKPNPMPESVTDRCTKAHEYIFLLSKSSRYWYDADAIAEPVKVGNNGSKFDGERDITLHPNTGRAPRKHDGLNTGADGSKIRNHNGESMNRPDGKRNKRSVWTVATQPYKGAHFATFPPALIIPCVLAGCPKGGTVIDPFGGSGTTGMVAEAHGRNAILIELNHKYCELIKIRNKQQVMI